MRAVRGLSRIGADHPPGNAPHGTLLHRSRITGFAGQPEAFVLALSCIAVWGVTGPIFGFSDTWQLVVNTGTTIVTFLMVFLIQNWQNRDAAAMQAKLDEIIRASGEARNRFIGIEHLTEKELNDLRERCATKAKVAELSAAEKAADQAEDEANRKAKRAARQSRQSLSIRPPKRCFLRRGGSADLRRKPEL